MATLTMSLKNMPSEPLPGWFRLCSCYEGLTQPTRVRDRPESFDTDCNRALLAARPFLATGDERDRSQELVGARGRCGCRHAPGCFRSHRDRAGRCRGGLRRRLSQRLQSMPHRHQGLADVRGGVHELHAAVHKAALSRHARMSRRHVHVSASIAAEQNDGEPTRSMRPHHDPATDIPGARGP
jgi:hypothetical protein